MKNSYSRHIEWLMSLINIQSFSREEDKAADFVQNLLMDYSLSPERWGNNIFVKSNRYTNEFPTVLLNSHLDTVKPAEAWTHNPFSASLEEGKLYGLGSNDAGASLMSLLEVFLQLQNLELPYNLCFLASAEEEISGSSGVELALKNCPPIEFAIVGEPTGMKMAIAEKGLMVCDCTVRGVSGHAAREEGDNAILKAMKQLELLQNHDLGKVSDTLGPLKISCTMIQSGTQHNVVPDKCEFVLDIRSTDVYNNEQVLEYLIDRLEAEIVPRSTRLKASGLPTDHPVLNVAKELGIETYGSPTLSDQALMDFPSIKMGPGDSARSHTADEYIKLKELEEAPAIYIEFLKKLKISKS